MNKKTERDIAEIDQALGKFAIADHREAVYPSLYDDMYPKLYKVIQVILGTKAKHNLKTKNLPFNEEEFKEAFKKAIGNEPNLERLIKYGTHKTGYSIEAFLKIYDKIQ
jgi:hypothetical protein